MAQKTLAGTPNVRYPDPLIRRTNPNGTQEFSSYQAWFCYYDVASAGYRFVLGFSGGGGAIDGLFNSVLLFGTDYPSIVSFFSQYETDTYDEFGDLNLIRNLSFPEALFPGLASVGGGIPFFSVFANPDETVTEYKEITPRVGVTATNNVEVQGFQYLAFTVNHGLWHSSEGQGGERAAFSLQANVTLNGATTHSTSSFVDILGQSLRIPVILYEPDFTQAIKDNQYILKDVLVYDTLFSGGQPIVADLDVVGIFTSAGYAPAPPTPPEPPPPFGNFPYNTYQAKFAYVGEGGTSVSIVNFPSTGQPVDEAEPWPITMLLFCSGAPTIINQRLDFGEGANNLGVDGLYIANQSPPLAAGYTQIPITTQQNLDARLTQSAEGVILLDSPYASYQQRVTGLTVTHSAEASGYFAQAVPTKNETIYYYNLGEEQFEYAVAEMNIDVIGESGEVAGPSNYLDKSGNRVFPIIVNEDTFGTYNIEPVGTSGIPYSFGIGTDYYVVVGIWAYPPPKAVGGVAPAAAPAAAPFSALESVENSPPLPPAAKAREDYKAKFLEALKFKKRR